VEKLGCEDELLSPVNTDSGTLVRPQRDS